MIVIVDGDRLLVLGVRVESFSVTQCVCVSGYHACRVLCRRPVNQSPNVGEPGTPNDALMILEINCSEMDYETSVIRECMCVYVQRRREMGKYSFLSAATDDVLIIISCLSPPVWERLTLAPTKKKAAETHNLQRRLVHINRVSVVRRMEKNYSLLPLPMEGTEKEK